MATTIDLVELTRSLVDIDSTTGREGEAGHWLARCLRDLEYEVVEQSVSDGRFNVYAHLGTPPSIVFSTHFDCVPPFFPSRVERGLVFGRGACDAKGILAAQVTAAGRLLTLRIRIIYMVSTSISTFIAAAMAALALNTSAGSIGTEPIGPGKMSRSRFPMQ